MATIKDVAREANLTVTTVSRILNNRGYISQESREKVYAAMKRLNYQPNEVARSLSRQKTNTIGVIVPHIVHPYFAKMISNIERAASDGGYKILLCNSREETERELGYLEMFQSNRVAGIILCSATVHTEVLMDLDIPVIAIERSLGAGTASVECDNYQGGMLATECLIQNGCQYLLHFSGVEDSAMPADDRALGFRDMSKKHGIRALEVKSRPREYYEMEYHQFIEKVLQDHPEADGIFASSDLIAAQVIQVCARLHRPIPSQVKLVGFDDVNVASLTTPRITTIKQPIKEMAGTAMDLLVKSSKGEMVPTRTVLPVQLVRRESC